MTKQITVNGKDIIAVGVPGDVYMPIVLNYPDANFSLLIYFTTGAIVNHEKIYHGKCEIRGTLTADTIDFDCGFLVNVDNWVGDNPTDEQMSEAKRIDFDSFRSLLTSHGFNFKNPEGEMPEYTVDRYYSKELSEEDVREIYEYDLKMWREAENSLVHKVVIIEKLITHDHPKED